jgi:ISXO2-like transposase domain
MREVLVRNASRESELHTDESRLCVEPGRAFAGHHTVKHSIKEYVRYEGERIVHSNTVENLSSVFKKGMIGTYQHCGPESARERTRASPSGPPPPGATVRRLAHCAEAGDCL